MIQTDKRRLVWVGPGVVAFLEELAAQRNMAMGELVKQLALREHEHPAIPIVERKRRANDIANEILKGGGK